jgi:hypothetical protein
MKKLIQYSLTVIALLVASIAIAQTDSTESDSTQNTREIIVDEGKVKIIIKEKQILMENLEDGDSSLERRLERIKIAIGDEDIDINLEDLNIDLEDLEELEGLEGLEGLKALEDLCEEEEPPFIETDWFNFQLGLTNLINENDEIAMPETYSSMELSTSKSVNFQVNIVQQAVNIYKGKVRLIYGVGVDFNNYRFMKDILLLEDSIPLMVEPSPIDYKKNKLVAQYLTVPVKLDLRLGKDLDESLTIAFGPNFQYLIGSHQKLKWKDDDGRTKKKIKDDYNLETFRIGYEVQFGYGNFVLYGKYFPESIFKADQGPNLRSVSAGIRIGNI